ncbi:MAG TPA: hypothetical protein VMF67_03800, partial [Rhizomicrobium sp.]|nr:hypothetical protein [Rhizomicrobium sp.]
MLRRTSSDHEENHGPGSGIQDGVDFQPAIREFRTFQLAPYLMPLGRLDEAETAARNGIALQPDGTNFYGTLSQIDMLRGNAGAA